MVLPLFLAVRDTQQFGNVLLQNIAGADFIQNQAQPLIDALKLPADLIQLPRHLFQLAFNIA